MAADFGQKEDGRGLIWAVLGYSLSAKGQEIFAVCGNSAWEPETFVPRLAQDDNQGILRIR